MKWKKPNGIVMDVTDNEATAKYAESLGWERVTATKKAPVKKAARKKVAK